MEPANHKNIHAAELVSRGGQKRMEQLSAQERIAIAKHAARTRWHQRQFNEEEERAREITYLFQQAIKNGK
jgi:hypothetical protein